MIVKIFKDEVKPESWGDMAKYLQLLAKNGMKGEIEFNDEYQSFCGNAGEVQAVLNLVHKYLI